MHNTGNNPHTDGENTLIQARRLLLHRDTKRTKCRIACERSAHRLKALMESYDIIILTDERYETPDESRWYQAQLLGEERFLMAGLEARGLRTTRVAWSNPHWHRNF